jgi:hypothetical protein
MVRTSPTASPFSLVTTFKDTKSIRGHKKVKNKDFLIFLHVDGMIRIREAQKLMDPKDPDLAPEHC